MRVECLSKKVDTDKIAKAIDDFKSQHRNLEKPSYIVMNRQTKAELWNSFGYSDISHWRLDVEPSGKKRQYEILFGIPIATCENLGYGEVEVI